MQVEQAPEPLDHGRRLPAAGEVALDRGHLDGLTGEAKEPFWWHLDEHVALATYDDRPASLLARDGVAKLRVAMRDGDLLPLATGFATAELKAANRWRKVVTPLGLEPSH
jgi:hypothetical protein